ESVFFEAIEEIKAAFDGAVNEAYEKGKRDAKKSECRKVRSIIENGERTFIVKPTVFNRFQQNINDRSGRKNTIRNIHKNGIDEREVGNINNDWKRKKKYCEATGVIKLANKFNRVAFYKAVGRLPVNDEELINWVMQITGIKKSPIHDGGLGDPF